MKTVLKHYFSNFSALLITRREMTNLTFVPRHQPVDESQLDRLQELIDNFSSVLVLTGAGISTESGIPDYRSEAVGLYARTNHRPIQHQEFVKYPAIRKRYWARNFVGWPKFSSVEPNISHLTLASWERKGKVTSIVTQNVDRLHQRAGSQGVIELHGSAYVVKCQNCDLEIPRHEFQEILTDLNPGLCIETIEMRPDADVALPQEVVDGFKLPHCDRCQDSVRGFFKPDIVFFGDNVPKSRVDLIYNQLESSDCLMVVGSSLHVYSGYRFILKANELHKPAIIINIGETRGDKFACLKISGKCSDILSKICI